MKSQLKGILIFPEYSHDVNPNHEGNPCMLTNEYNCVWDGLLFENVKTTESRLRFVGRENVRFNLYSGF
jgi:hypothetical protein